MSLVYLDRKERYNWCVAVVFAIRLMRKKDNRKVVSSCDTGKKSLEGKFDRKFAMSISMNCIF